jgi:hypothetical protein
MLMASQKPHRYGKTILVEQGYGVCGACDERAHQVSSSNSLISLAMTVFPQERLRQNHNWEKELSFRDGMRTWVLLP